MKFYVMNILYKKIEELIPYEFNNKIHWIEQINRIANSIKEFWFLNPILIDENNIIIAGHGRLEWAKKLKLKEVPTITTENLTKEQIKKYRILDNRLADLSEYNLENLKLELEELGDQDLIDLFDEFELWIGEEERDEEQEDTTPPVSELEPIVKLWDRFQLWEHILVCWDSTKPESYTRDNKEVIADLLFTDPPYNVNYKGKWKKTSNGIKNDNMSDQNFKLFLEDIFEQIANHINPSTPLYVFHSHKTQRVFEDAMNDNNIEIISQLIRNKPSINHVWGDYKQKHEPFFYAKIKNKKIPFYWTGIYEETVIDIPDFSNQSNKEIINYIKNIKEHEQEWYTTIRTHRRHNVQDYDHPTQKPVWLVELALNNSSKEWDCVLDPFGWSWTTLIACEKLNRTCHTIELDPKYVEVIIRRFAKVSQKNIKCLNREMKIQDILNNI